MWECVGVLICARLSILSICHSIWVNETICAKSEKVTYVPMKQSCFFETSTKKCDPRLSIFSRDLREKEVLSHVIYAELETMYTGPTALFCDFGCTPGSCVGTPQIFPWSAPLIAPHLVPTL